MERGPGRDTQRRTTLTAGGDACDWGGACGRDGARPARGAQELTRALAEQHARLLAPGAGDEVSEDAFEALVACAQSLLAFEERLPGRLAEPQRLRSQRVVFWSWRVQSGLAAALIATLFVLGHTAWWLVLIVPHLLATFAGWSLKATPKEHRARRQAAIGLHLVGVLFVLVVLGVLSAWFIIAVLAGWAVVGLAFTDEQGAGEVSDNLEYRMQAADGRVRDLDCRLDDLEDDHQSLKDRFGYSEDLDYELRRVRSDVSECESEIERVEGRVQEIEGDLGGRVGLAEQAVERLRQHVRLLEGQIIAAGGARAADLDTFTKDQRALARTMLAGRAAADALLSDWDRRGHQLRVDRFRDSRLKHRAARENVIALAGALAGSRFGTDAHTEAATQLRAAIADEGTLRQNMDRQAADAKKAADELAADTEARADKQPAIAAGVRAEKRLTVALRSRLAEAVSSRCVLPVWFVTVLGSAPPARQTDEWLECATGVLLYRLTYGIDDQVVSLGPTPTAASAHGRGWYDELRKKLRRW